jgi:hypothetical protein
MSESIEPLFDSPRIAYRAGVPGRERSGSVTPSPSACRAQGSGPMREPCRCRLCRRHSRVAYIIRQLRRNGDESAGDWLEGLYDHLLDMETTVEMYEHA